MRRTFLHRIVLSAFVFLFVNLNSFSQNGTITGRVKYGKEALQGATVLVGNKITITDQKGEFSFSVKAGHYTLAITHAGYTRMEKDVTVSAGANKNFDFDMVPNEQLGEVVTLGSRSLIQRSNLNTAVPVDAFSSAQLSETGQTSLMQMLSYTAPSLNASMQNAPEPVTLRGLYPDQILILLNGTRYNNTAYINTGNISGGIPFRGQLGRGSVTNDLNSIPFSAIEKIEILRDGASAQYGSDAVAGVINITLKESMGKPSVSLHLGQQYKGDGETIRLGINNGVTLNKKGFLNYSADFRYRGPTFRGGEYTGTVYYNIDAKYSQSQIDSVIALDNQKIKDRGFDRKQASNAGNAESASVGLLMNGAYPINNKTKIFWTGALNNTSFAVVFPYFFPKMALQVNTVLFPDGFKGSIKPDTWNVSGIAGVKGVVGKEIFWEYSSAYGSNSSKYYAENTNNASQQFSLGKNAPTNFYTAYLRYQQLTNTLHFTKNILSHGNKLKSINLDWGGELRLENFRMKPGEEASWFSYDSAGRKNGGSQTSLIVSPRTALNKYRNVMCAYVDLEGDFKARFLFAVAGRFEHYSDFGSNVAGKLAARYKLSRTVSVRGSVSNGFRAPSMQQRYWSLINSGFIRGGSTASPTRSGIFNNESDVAKLFGVPSLEAEKSLNFSGGFTSTISGRIYLTIDGYWIQIKNRVVLGGRFDRSNDEVDRLLNASSLRDSTITQVSFFSNAISTRTKGIDLVLHGKWNFNQAQLIASLSANFTRTQLFGDIKVAANLSPADSNKNTLFNREQISNLEDGQPRSKIILDLDYKKGKLGFMLRNTRFGETAFQHVVVATGKIQPQETFSPKILTDLSISYTPKSLLTITAGANNIFDVYPDGLKNSENTNGGLYIYAMEASPFGFNGGYYYVNMSFSF